MRTTNKSVIIVLFYLVFLTEVLVRLHDNVLFMFFSLVIVKF